MVTVVRFLERSKIRLLIAGHDHGQIESAKGIQKQYLYLRIMLDVQVISLRVNSLILAHTVQFSYGRQRLLHLVVNILLFADYVFE